MKISLIADSSSNWYVREFKKVAKKQNIQVELVSVLDYDNWGNKIEQMGDVVWWVGTSVPNKFSVRSAFLRRCLEAQKIVVNLGLATQPQIVFKSYQQMALSDEGIATFAFRKKIDLMTAVQKKKLIYPFIVKPDYGNQGKGIVLVRDLKELNKLPEIRGFIVQNFIENDGDFRVFVLGGRAMWVVKRVAPAGGFLNNVAQGGVPQLVSDGPERARICNLAEKVAAKFDLNFCGIDIIKDKKTGRLYFMEVNTLPSLKVFQPVFADNLMETVLNYFKLLSERKTKKVEVAVMNYYDQSVACLHWTKQFHYLMRRAFWFEDKKAFSQLAGLQDNFLKVTHKKMKRKVVAKNKHRSSIRAVFEKKYPRLGQYDHWLFQWLYAQNVYQLDLKETILQHVNELELKQFSSSLLADRQALFYLSTKAVTCLYNIHWFLGDNQVLRNKTAELLYTVAKHKLKEHKSGDQVFAIYLLTHAVLGESQFYFKPVRGKIYVEMFRLIENVIRDNYATTSCDCKLEFLVCGRLINQKTDLEPIIYSEVENSLSPLGNFIADAPDQVNRLSDSFSRSEHRNILYLMSKHNKFKNK